MRPGSNASARCRRLEIAKRQAFEEAEIVSGEEVERARIATERGLNEARVIRDRDLQKLGDRKGQGD